MTVVRVRVDPSAEWPLRVDGATLRVFEYGTPDPSAPVLLLVHGYPDDHHVFDPLIAALGAEYRVISYDTRAAGRSTLESTALHNARLPKLVDDMFAVIDSIPGHPKPVHVLGHDWGSIQAWDAMRDSRASFTVASYISISGPSIDHLRQYSRQSLLRPRSWPIVLAQLGRSWYVYGFAIPGLSRLPHGSTGPLADETSEASTSNETQNEARCSTGPTSCNECSTGQRPPARFRQR